uniref:S9 family peptidase n=1 Tax=Mimivirus LCMiAC01 TaxID=2506608 RepID=A0A481YZ50_9VIRU|nr:MAG: S9 family peptidase [Mimivirus LCMiAC01]
MDTNITRHNIQEKYKSIATYCGKYYDKPSNLNFIGNTDALYCLKNVEGTSLLHQIVYNDEKKYDIVPVTLPNILDDKRKLTQEEIMLKQRKRELRIGLISFGSLLVDKTQYIHFSSGPRVFLYDIGAEKLREITGKEECVKLDYKFTHDGKFFGFIRENEIWIQDTNQSDNVKQLTFDTKNKNVTAGVSDFIMQEEFDRTTGYWFGNGIINDSHYVVAYLKVDSSDVTVINIEEDGKTNEYPYPLAGEKNTTSVLVTVEFDKDLKIYNRVEHTDLFKKRFPWVEYVVDCGIPPKNSGYPNTIWMKLLDRKQKKYCIVLYDYIAQTSEIIHEETCDKYWINVSPVLYFFEDGTMRIIIGSEKSGYHHLYLVKHYEWEPEVFIISKALTSGEFSVAQKSFGQSGITGQSSIIVDEKNKKIYFTGRGSSPLIQELYEVSLESGKMVSIGEKGYYHEQVTFSDDFSTFAAFISNTKNPPKYVIWKRGKDGTYNKTGIVAMSPQQEPVKAYIPLISPELFSFKSTKGNEIHGYLYRPLTVTDSSPLILNIYGGPLVQLVNDHYLKSTVNPSIQLLLQLGFYVVIIDAEGTKNRGFTFESEIYKKMGCVELNTQIEGIKYIINKHKLPIDMKRIGIYGYSYGGYMSLMALAKHNDFFKVAVAGSPVSNWMLYDTGYTERYMGSPQENKDAYNNANVCTFAKDFPNEPHRLLITHGLSDENVFFNNTYKIMSALIQEDKPFDIQIYPQQRHMFTDPKSRMHMLTERIMYFVENL